MTRNNPRKNAEGYDNPTEYHALRNILKQEDTPDKRCNALIAVLKYIINAAGFDLLNRIELRDRKTKNIYR